MATGIEIFEQPNPGYQMLTAYGSWRVAIMNDSEKTMPDGIAYLQKHDLTDEVFVLLRGTCTLITAGGSSQPDRLTFMPMQPGKAYNVRACTWHTHVLEKDTSVFIVENADTVLGNSPVADITQEQRRLLIEHFR